MVDLFVPEKVENNVEIENKNASYQQFLLFSQCFLLYDTILILMTLKEKALENTVGKG